MAPFYLKPAMLQSVNEDDHQPQEPSVKAKSTGLFVGHSFPNLVLSKLPDLDERLTWKGTTPSRPNAQLRLAMAAAEKHQPASEAEVKI